MSFSFVDVEAKKSRTVIFLFLTLITLHLAGFVLLYAVLDAATVIDGSSHSRPLATLPSARAAAVLLVLALTTAFVHWSFSTRKMVNRILRVLGAERLDPEDRCHHLFKNVVEEISVASGGRLIEPRVITSRYLNAFAVRDFGGRAVIGVTEGLLTKLSRSQLEAVVAHEASHIAWGDSLVSTVTCSIVAVYAGMLNMALSGWQGRGRSIYPRRAGLTWAGPILVALLFVLRVLTRLLNTWISRESELRADATAVRFTRNPLSLAEALYVIGGAWRGSDLPAENLASLFIVTPRRRSFEERAKPLAAFFSTHPPLRRRIGVLLDMGHLDFESMRSNIRSRPRTVEVSRVPEETGGKAWNLFHEGLWQGPFDLKELMTLSWLGPFTWVSVGGAKEALPAHEFPALNKLFKKNLPPALAVSACPSCGKGLERVYYEGVPLWRCGGCRGRLLSREKLLRILVREQRGFTDGDLEAVRRMAEQARRDKGRYVKKTEASYSCPCCGQTMERTFYHAILPYHMELDHCRRCRLTWFDAHELEIVQYLTEGARAGR